MLVELLYKKKQQHDLMMQRHRSVRLTRDLMLYSPIGIYIKTFERTALKVSNDEFLETKDINAQ